MIWIEPTHFVEGQYAVNGDFKAIHPIFVGIANFVTYTLVEVYVLEFLAELRNQLDVARQRLYVRFVVKCLGMSIYYVLYGNRDGYHVAYRHLVVYEFESTHSYLAHRDYIGNSLYMFLHFLLQPFIYLHRTRIHEPLDEARFRLVEHRYLELT